MTKQLAVTQFNKLFHSHVLAPAMKPVAWKKFLWTMHDVGVITKVQRKAWRLHFGPMP